MRVRAQGQRQHRSSEIEAGDPPLCVGGDGDARASSRFPGASERIPNFANARGAAERLARHPAWKQAKTIKANPDAPQTHSRRLALEQGKILVMAVPRLRDAAPVPAARPEPS